jgi:hypothetical protein
MGTGKGETMRTSLRVRVQRSHKNRTIETIQVPVSIPKTNNKSLILIALIFIVVIGTASANMYQVYGYVSTIFTPQTVQSRLLSAFNEDRSIYGVYHVVLDPELSNRSYYRAMDIRDYNLEKDATYLREDIFIVSKEEFSRSYYNSPGIFVDTWRNTDKRFRLNELNRDNGRVGIGVAEGNNNFYIVVRWE